MKKSMILAVPLLALTLLVAFTSESRAVVADASKQVSVEKADKMHKRIYVRFCGRHCHHHSHFWCSGWADFWCPGHH